MNLPASLLTTLTTEEELEAIMNDAAVIQGGDAAVGAATVEPTVIQANVEKRKKKDMRPNEVTNEPTEHVVAESPQNESASEQIALKQTKNREARQKKARRGNITSESPIESLIFTEYTPSEYELYVMEKRKRNAELLIDLGLSAPTEERTRAAAIRLPVTQLDEDTDKEEKEGSKYASAEENEEVLLSLPNVNTLCCCGCGLDAAQSNHYCTQTGKRVMAWCFHESQEVDEGFGSKALCKTCYMLASILSENDNEKVPLSTAIAREVSAQEHHEEDDEEYDEELPLSAQEHHEEDDDEYDEELPLISGLCCCGCGLDAAQSNHYCIHTRRRVMSWCFHESEEVEERGREDEEVCPGKGTISSNGSC
jgi:hypothetical protein